MYRYHLPLLLAVAISISGCGLGSRTNSGNVAHDLTTPEGAILCLEDAYRKKDIEAAVRCKDFTTEAKLMLQSVGQRLADDQEIVAETAETLELAFRAEMSESGFPDFSNCSSTFTDRQPYNGLADVVQVTEICIFADGTTTKNLLGASRTEEGWKVVMLPE